MTIPQIALVHTAPIHQQTFTDLLAGEPCDAQHSVHAAWLADAQHQGLSDNLRITVTEHLLQLAATHDAVLCTCSTLGPLVDELGVDRIVRIDAPMMMQAALAPGKVLLAYCLDSTLEPSCQLLLQAYARRNRPANFTPLDCTGLWPMFQAQHLEQFAHALAQQIHQALQLDQDICCVVLAQASMAPAADLLESLAADVQVLDSPRLALQQTLLMANQHRH